MIVPLSFYSIEIHHRDRKHVRATVILPGKTGSYGGIWWDIWVYSVGRTEAHGKNSLEINVLISLNGAGPQQFLTALSLIQVGKRLRKAEGKAGDMG